MNAIVVGREIRDDDAKAVLTVTQPVPSLTSRSEPALPSPPEGICVNCGREVTLQVVATEEAHRTYQWVPTSEPARLGRWCQEASMPAYHWAEDATAAVYRISI